MYESRIDLSVDVRKNATALLQARLSDTLDLTAQTKQAHWNVVGSHFYPLHELFDEIHEQVRETVDALAERITALGGIADGRVQTTASATSLEEYALDTRSADAHLEHLATVLARFAKNLRVGIEQANQIGDAGSADLLTGISRMADKQLWLLEAHLADSDDADARR
jgi:starvation-inducible DNA-binding protein